MGFRRSFVAFARMLSCKGLDFQRERPINVNRLWNLGFPPSIQPPIGFIQVQPDGLQQFNTADVLPAAPPSSQIADANGNSFNYQLPVQNVYGAAPAANSYASAPGIYQPPAYGYVPVTNGYEHGHSGHLCPPLPPATQIYPPSSYPNPPSSGYGSVPKPPSSYGFQSGSYAFQPSSYIPNPPSIGYGSVPQPPSSYGSQPNSYGDVQQPQQLHGNNHRIEYAESAYFAILPSVDLSRCFTRYTETKLSGIEPYKNNITRGIEECLVYCLSAYVSSQLCESVVFSPKDNECQLFSRTGRWPPGRFFMQYGYDYYEPTYCAGCDVGNSYMYTTYSSCLDTVKILDVPYGVTITEPPPYSTTATTKPTETTTTTKPAETTTTTERTITTEPIGSTTTTETTTTSQSIDTTVTSESPATTTAETTDPATITPETTDPATTTPETTDPATTTPETTDPATTTPETTDPATTAESTDTTTAEPTDATTTAETNPETEEQTTIPTESTVEIDETNRPDVTDNLVKTLKINKKIATQRYISSNLTNRTTTTVQPLPSDTERTTKQATNKTSSSSKMNQRPSAQTSLLKSHNLTTASGTATSNVTRHATNSTAKKQAITKGKMPLPLVLKPALKKTKSG